ncbi:hypothetical protein FJZ33_07480, partial [Candidatus Poribacteria bacterium]|nr:hypothetical protein [Candidatus Poribacteria bacterium]
MKTSRISLLYFLIFILLSISYLHADTFIVDNLSDIDDGNPYNVADGKNTLRKCIRLANDNPGNDYIIFNISGTISLTSALYPICDSITIDASSLWIGEWPGGKPGIILDGLNAGADADGIFISGANYCQIRGMFITNFKSNGIKIVADSSFNTIGGGGVGYRNVISKNLNGIAILGTSGVPSNNIISGNYIGTDVDGTVDLGNSMHGVLIAGGAKLNFVGGSTDNERNVISGNDRRGINISGSDTDGNIILGNYLGTDFSGSKPLGNTRCGVAVEKGGRSNIIDGNIISGNNGNGIRIVDSGSDNNKILKNYIGTDRSGISNIGNTENGIYIHNGPQSNTVIENIIAFNGMVGIKIE